MVKHGLNQVGTEQTKGKNGNTRKIGVVFVKTLDFPVLFQISYHKLMLCFCVKDLAKHVVYFPCPSAVRLRIKN